MTRRWTMCANVAAMALAVAAGAARVCRAGGSPSPRPIVLWPGGAPDALGQDDTALGATLTLFLDPPLALQEVPTLQLLRRGADELDC